MRTGERLQVVLALLLLLWLLSIVFMVNFRSQSYSEDWMFHVEPRQRPFEETHP